MKKLICPHCLKGDCTFKDGKKSHPFLFGTIDTFRYKVDTKQKPYAPKVWMQFVPNAPKTYIEIFLANAVERIHFVECGLYTNK